MRASFLCTALAGLSAVLGLSQVATAQELSGSDRATVTFNEVEHGFYADAQAGVLFLQSPGLNSGLGSGTVVGVSIGYDFSSLFGLGIFALTAAVAAPNGYGGTGTGLTVGDYTAIMPGIEGRLHLPLAKDGNEVERVFLNVGAGIGLMFLQPRGLFPTSGEAVGAKVNVGLEYFTHVRHMSLGLTLDGLASFPSGGTLAGVALSPFIKYSF